MTVSKSHSYFSPEEYLEIDVKADPTYFSTLPTLD